MNRNQQRGTGYVAALVTMLGGDVVITDEQAVRSGDLVIDYDPLTMQTRIRLKPEQLQGEIVTAEPQSITSIASGPKHQCESWQIRRNADDGGRYCAGCGATI